MSIPFSREEFLEAINELMRYEQPDANSLGSWTNQRKAALLKKIAGCMVYLDGMHLHIEGIHLPSFVFDLSNPVIAAKVIVHRLESESLIPLVDLKGKKFFGSGVYTLYYSGEFEAYAAISETMCPIYVGSASPKDKTADTPRKQKTALYDRLMEHLGKSIEKAETTLKVEHFSCKYLLVQTGLELAAEQFLMRQYHPVWNKEEQVCAGFGKHGDMAEAAPSDEDEIGLATGEASSTRKVGGRKEKSRWDILHPGRPWATNQRSLKQADKEIVTNAIINHFAKLYNNDRERWKSVFNAAWVGKQQ